MKWLLLSLAVLAVTALIWYFLLRQRGRAVQADVANLDTSPIGIPAAEAGLVATAVAAGTATAGSPGELTVTPAAFEDGAYPGSARPCADGSAPTAEFTVKGNEHSKRYHTPDSPQYHRAMAEVWFRSEADAQRAGFASWKRHDR